MAFQTLALGLWPWRLRHKKWNKLGKCTKPYTHFCKCERMEGNGFQISFNGFPLLEFILSCKCWVESLGCKV